MGRARLTGSTGQRVLKTLAAVVEAPYPLTLPELAAAVALPKPTVQRMARLLEDKGYAIKDPGSRGYAPGPVMHRLSLALLQSQSHGAARHAILQAMAEDVGEACNIVLLDGSQLTYIDRVDTAWPLRLRFEIGSHVPLHCTATGKLLLALQPKRVRDRLTRSMPLRALTARSITNPGRLETAFKTIRRERLGSDDQEFLEEMVAVAVPIDTPSGPPVAALSIHAPVFRRTLRDLRDFTPQLRAAAARLSVVFYGGDDGAAQPVEATGSNDGNSDRERTD